jgi:hypothetical protein
MGRDIATVTITSTAEKVAGPSRSSTSWTGIRKHRRRLATHFRHDIPGGSQSLESSFWPRQQWSHQIAAEQPYWCESESAGSFPLRSQPKEIRMIKRFGISLASLMLVLPVVAQAQTGSIANDKANLRNDHGVLQEDKAQHREDRLQRREDRRELARDRAIGDKAAIANDKANLLNDRKTLANDRANVSGDRQQIGADRRNLRQDKRF